MAIAGHDVLAVAEASPGISDMDVLHMATIEDRILITFDHDFGALVFRRATAAGPGVILFRLIPQAPDEPAQVLLSLMEQTDIRFKGRFTVIDRDRVRQRRLPDADGPASNM
ncbi:MAG: DUF5615 family PIN-like protein [Candidatus Eisenbacteria sp.]|nr:DUF5615 family PIN-like protein [Candidatus Eisenbacteria bacterium]